MFLEFVLVLELFIDKISPSEPSRTRKSISPAMKKNFTFDAVERLASDAFLTQQQRLSRNICLKIYDGFVSRMQVSDMSHLDIQMSS